MKKIVTFICVLFIFCGLVAQSDTDAGNKAEKQLLASKRLKYIKYSTATYGYGNDVIAEKILSVANSEERKYFDDTVKDYTSKGSSNSNARANAINLLIEQMKKNDIKTLADLDQLENDIKDLQGKIQQPKVAQPEPSTPKEPSAVAKAECAKVTSVYYNLKRDYMEAKKKIEQGGNFRLSSMSGDSKYSTIIKDSEKKLKEISVTTVEAKQLKAKLLKQLQLGRELKPDEVESLKVE